GPLPRGQPGPGGPQLVLRGAEAVSGDAKPFPRFFQLAERPGSAFLGVPQPAQGAVQLALGVFQVAPGGGGGFWAAGQGPLRPRVIPLVAAGDQPVRTQGGEDCQLPRRRLAAPAPAGAVADVVPVQERRPVVQEDVAGVVQVDPSAAQAAGQGGGPPAVG